jgi:hypothetical protein
MEPEAVAVELARLSTTLELLANERERATQLFRQEMREAFERIEATIREHAERSEVHAAEDTRRFDLARGTLDTRIAELYAYVDEQGRDRRIQDRERRKERRKIAGAVIAASASLVTALISAHRSGIL